MEAMEAIQAGEVEVQAAKAAKNVADAVQNHLRVMAKREAAGLVPAKNALVQAKNALGQVKNAPAQVKNKSNNFVVQKSTK